MSFAADYAAYAAKVLAPWQIVHEAKASVSGPTGRLLSSWPTASPPTTAVALDRTTVGALGQQNTSGVQRLVGFEVGNAQPFALQLRDRLCHSGGLNDTLPTEQTTNLPTPALTRYTSGVDVRMALALWTDIGNTATTATVKYTNSASAAGQVSPAQQFGGLSYRTLAREIDIPYVVGDVGAKVIESVTLAASTVGTGNFGALLYKPLSPWIPCSWLSGPYDPWDAILDLCGCCQQVPDDSCLYFAIVPYSTLSGIYQAAVKLAEE